MTRTWLVRAGKRGENWDTNLAESVASVGWSAVGDLGPTRNRHEVRALLDSGYPTITPALLGNWTGQLFRFRHEIAKGDLIITPLRQTNTIAIGRVVGGYRHRPDLPDHAKHTVPVTWLRTDLARTVFGQNLLYSLGSLLTVAEIAKNDAVRRIEHLAAHGTDPGAADADLGTGEEPDAASVDLERLAYDRINNFLGERFSGHDMARLVEAIFQARGLTTYRSPKGADGGIDVLAGGGPLGMDPPRICVQVKFTSGPADAGVVRELEGVMQRVRAEQGLLVSWNGITQAAQREVRQQFFRVRVWSADDVLRELTAVYDKLPEDLQIELPLKRVWMLAVDDSDGAAEE